jgi:hypothetical protein
MVTSRLFRYTIGRFVKTCLPPIVGPFSLYRCLNFDFILQHRSSSNSCRLTLTLPIGEYFNSNGLLGGLLFRFRLDLGREVARGNPQDRVYSVQEQATLCPNTAVSP